MIRVNIIGSARHQMIDLLTDDEPDQLGAVRIVPGNIGGEVKAIIVGNDDMHPGQLGPMFNGSYVTSHERAFRAEAERVLGCALPGHPNSQPIVPLHDRYESIEQYNLLSA